MSESAGEVPGEPIQSEGGETGPVGMELRNMLGLNGRELKRAKKIFQEDEVLYGNNAMDYAVDAIVEGQRSPRGRLGLVEVLDRLGLESYLQAEEVSAKIVTQVLLWKLEAGLEEELDVVFVNKARFDRRLERVTVMLPSRDCMVFWYNYPEPDQEKIVSMQIYINYGDKEIVEEKKKIEDEKNLSWLKSVLNRGVSDDGQLSIALGEKEKDSDDGIYRFIFETEDCYKEAKGIMAQMGFMPTDVEDEEVNQVWLYEGDYCRINVVGVDDDKVLTIQMVVSDEQIVRAEQGLRKRLANEVTMAIGRWLQGASEAYPYNVMNDRVVDQLTEEVGVQLWRYPWRRYVRGEDITEAIKAVIEKMTEDLAEPIGQSTIKLCQQDGKEGMITRLIQGFDLKRFGIEEPKDVHLMYEVGQGEEGNNIAIFKGIWLSRKSYTVEPEVLPGDSIGGE